MDSSGRILAAWEDLLLANGTNIGSLVWRFKMATDVHELGSGIQVGQLGPKEIARHAINWLVLLVKVIVLFGL